MSLPECGYLDGIWQRIAFFVIYLCFSVYFLTLFLFEQMVDQMFDHLFTSEPNIHATVYLFVTNSSGAMTGGARVKAYRPSG